MDKQSKSVKVVRRVPET